ncbi:hypothetical protein [Photobacterium nomapromontoriensis]|uniref:hypothetical protein n=1 Tax=Photobacterium nomapromontoriensis TaxID=2910237 RepID=UPI003D096F22
MNNSDLVTKAKVLATQPSKAVTGEVLKLHDAEMKLINSGPLGMKRLAAARSIDIQEACPSMSENDANKIGAGYVMLKVMGASGQLTSTTKAEVARLEQRNKE